MGTLSSTFSIYWNEFATSRLWSQITTNHKLRRQGFLICRNLWLSQFVTVQNTNSQIDLNSARGYTFKYRRHVHIDIGPFQESFFGTSFLAILTDMHTQIYQWNNTKMGKNATFHIHVKSVQNTFSVLLDSVCHATALITNRHISNCDTFSHKLRHRQKLWRSQIAT